ncbi:MAG: PIG-L deacetylase family protein [Promethearchaeota archaeon]
MPKYIFFQAHPDDLELNCAYLLEYILKRSHYDNIVKIVSATKGEFGLPGHKFDKFKGKILAKIRTRELENALAIHGLSKNNIIFLGLIDGFVEFNKELINKIKNILIEEKPDVVVAPEPIYTWYFHKDHVNVGKAVFYTIYNFYQDNHQCKRPKLLFYSSTSPNFYFPIKDKSFKLINKLIECHKTQFWLLNWMKLLLKPLGLYFGLFTPHSLYAEPYRIIYFDNYTTNKKNKPKLLGYLISRFCFAHQNWYSAKYPQNMLNVINAQL